jgi:hypothetical protein
MDLNPDYSSWLEWCNQKNNCEIRYLDNRCEVKVIVSPILSIDTVEHKISVAGKIIPLRNLLSIQPLTS